jgi:selenium-binding protein 1
MTLLRPDQTFYPSPQMACKAPAEKFGYVATLNYGRNDRPDAGVQPNGAGWPG